MRLFKLFFIVLIFVAALAACGGGGGALDSVGNSPDGTWLKLTPSPVELTTYQGENLVFQITATSSRTFAQSFNIAIIDSVGVISSKMIISKQSQLVYEASMQIASGLSLGVHSSKLEVRVCEDNAAVCLKPFPGSPWFVPITVTVKPVANLTSLQKLPNLGEWSTHLGKSTNANYVPASFDSSKFSRRWKLNTANILRGQIPVADGGLHNIL